MPTFTNSQALQAFATDPGLAGSRKINGLIDVGQTTLKESWATKLTYDFSYPRKYGRYISVSMKGTAGPARLTPQMVAPYENSISMLDTTTFNTLRFSSMFTLDEKTWEESNDALDGDLPTIFMEANTEAMRKYREGGYLAILTYAVQGRTAPSNLDWVKLTTADGKKLFTNSANAHTFLGQTAAAGNYNMPTASVTPSIAGLRTIDTLVRGWVDDRNYKMDTYAENILTSGDYEVRWNETVKNVNNPETANRADNPVKFMRYKREVTCIENLPASTTIFETNLARTKPRECRIYRLHLGDVKIYHIFEELLRMHKYAAEVYEKFCAPPAWWGYCFGQDS